MKKLFLILLAFPVCCSAQHFSDVPGTHPNAMAIDWLFEEGLVEGYTEEGVKVFHPERSVTRAAALKMLIGTSGITFTPLEELPFPDVPTDQWYSRYIKTALDIGIVKGYTDGKFHPASQVTRAEFLSMALRTFEAPIGEEDAGDWARPLFELATTMRIVDPGDPTHTSLNRGEVAEIIFRVSQVAQSEYREKFTYSGQGTAGWEGILHNGKKMTNGQEFDSEQMYAAHRSLPLGTKIRIWNSSGNVIITTITDRYIRHDENILSLTEKAFRLLGGGKNQSTSIQFEVYADPTDSIVSVPEYVRPELSDQLHTQPVVPSYVSEAISSQDIVEDIPPLWEEVVPMLGTNFYEHIEMRSPFPQKVLADGVVNFSGRTDEIGHKKITVFLQPLTNEEGRDAGQQYFFTDDISGKNFVVPIHFPNAGFFQMGVVLDDAKKSRVETIEVIRKDRERVMRISTKDFDDSFELRLVPEDKEVIFDLPEVADTDILKIDFSQGSTRDRIIFEGGIKEFAVPYSWFQKFRENETLSLDIYGAESKDGSIASRNTGWKKITFQNYQVIPGFRDIELSSISIHDFPRWKRDTTPFTLMGTILEPGVTLPDHAYLITPSGKVREMKLTRVVDDISFEVILESEGAHTIEVVEESGEILFNRQIFVSEKWVLPVLDPVITELPSETVPGVRAWINRVRSESGVESVSASMELNNFAQAYSDRMENENFISHTSPTGQTFETRIKASGVPGTEFAENLGFGTTLQLALDELRASGSHLQNIINRRWKYVGIGITKSHDGWYVVQVFSR